MSETVRQWGLRLVALAVAIGLWFNLSYREREAMSERTIDVPVSYNQPRGFVVVNPVATVKVHLRGNSKTIRSLYPYNIDVQVKLPQARVGNVTLDLGPENVLRPEDLQVVSIRPNVLHVTLDREMTRNVPVHAKTTGKPAGGATAGEPLAIPSEIMVTGPESSLAKIRTLPTRPVSLEGHALSFEEETEVVIPDLLQAVPSTVVVRVQLTPEPPAEPAAEPAPHRRKKR